MPLYPACQRLNEGEIGSVRAAAGHPAHRSSAGPATGKPGGRQQSLDLGQIRLQYPVDFHVAARCQVDGVAPESLGRFADRSGLF